MNSACIATFLVSIVFLSLLTITSPRNAILLFLDGTMGKRGQRSDDEGDDFAVEAAMASSAEDEDGGWQMGVLLLLSFLLLQRMDVRACVRLF